MFQTLNDAIDPAFNGWPFGKVAAAASAPARRRGAVVVHVGDFTYRHEACPLPFPTELTEKQREQQRTFGDCVGTGANWGDTSAGWAADFFEPAAPLLRVAPWLVLRGNHETCKRGGMGWFRYLEPRPVEDPIFEGGASAAYPWRVSETPPYSVDFENDQWLVIDSNDVGDEGISIDDYPQQAFTEEDALKFQGSEAIPMSANCTRADSGDKDAWMVAGLMELVQQGKRHWIGIHRPVYAITYETEDDKQPGLYSFQCEIANAINRANISIPDMPAVVSGHAHHFQMVEYERAPAQLAFGNGGTQLKTPLNGEPVGLTRLKGRNITMLGDTVQSSPTVGQFGYGVLRVGGPTFAPTMTAEFLHDASFAGAPDVTAKLPLRTFVISGTSWRSG